MTQEVKRKRKRNNKKVSFDEEIVSKGEAIEIISKNNEENVNRNKVNIKKSNKQKQKASKDNNENPIENNSEPTIKKSKKRKMDKFLETATTEEVVEELDPKKPEIKKTESIREKKRKRFKELLEKKRLKSEVNMRDQCLNYLSKWKYNRDSWKFEKLRQIWLQQHIVDSNKIPDEFWNTALDYFNNSQGKSKKLLLASALKIVEKVDSTKEEISEDEKLKYNRAREIVQFLQE